MIADSITEIGISLPWGSSSRTALKASEYSGCHWNGRGIMWWRQITFILGRECFLLAKQTPTGTGPKGKLNPQELRLGTFNNCSLSSLPYRSITSGLFLAASTTNTTSAYPGGYYHVLPRPFDCVMCCSHPLRECPYLHTCDPNSSQDRRQPTKLRVQNINCSSGCLLSFTGASLSNVYVCSRITTVLIKIYPLWHTQSVRPACRPLSLSTRSKTTVPYQPALENVLIPLIKTVWMVEENATMMTELFHGRQAQMEKGGRGKQRNSYQPSVPDFLIRAPSVERFLYGVLSETYPKYGWSCFLHAYL